jgi:hypothetical protein
MSTQLPLLLAGPIVRQLSPKSVVIWIALADSIETEVKFTNPKSRQELKSTSTSQRYQISKRCHICLISATLADSVFSEAPVEYDIFRSAADGGLLHSLFQPDARSWLALPGFDGPTIHFGAGSGNILIGSCRKLHASGPDAILTASKVAKSESRPDALFLIGDQIYCDDVSFELLHAAYESGLINSLIDGGPGNPSYLSLEALSASIGSRGRFLVEHSDRQNRVTAEPGDVFNHLCTVQEVIALYLISWSPAICESVVDSAISLLSASRIGWNSTQIDHLRSLKEETRVYAKLFANCPTYMLGDDHDVTDDYRFDYQWIRNNCPERVSGRSLIRDYLLYAEAMYVVFQHAGNVPDATSTEELLRALETALVSDRVEGLAQALNLYRAKVGFCFVAGTTPRVLALDSRYGRTIENGDPESLQRYESSSMLGRERPVPQSEWTLTRRRRRQGTLLPTSSAQLEPLRSLISEATSNGTLYLVTQTPVLALPFIESALDNRSDELFYDNEGWASNPDDLIALFRALSDGGARDVVCIAGDLHFAYAGLADWSLDGDSNSGRMTQYVTSGLKNQNSSLLRLLDGSFGARSKFAAYFCRGGNDPLRIERYFALTEQDCDNPRSVGNELFRSMPERVRPNLRLHASFETIRSGSRRIVSDHNYLTLSLPDGSAVWSTANGPYHYSRA